MDSRVRGVNSLKKQLLSYKKVSPSIGYGRTEIRTIDDRPIWSLMKEYINSLDVNQIITRKNLLVAVYGNLGIYMSRYPSTVDGYTRCIKIVNCIEKFERGKYRKLKNIPIDLSISKLKKHVSGNNWKTWFIPIEDI